MIREQVNARHAIEALRSGVPSPLAVRQLGTTQEHVRDLFDERLDIAADGSGVEPLVLTATFGAGKSHLLNCLRARAADRGFVTTLAVVGPEMPLGNAHVVLKAIAEGASAPGRSGAAASALASDLNTGSEDFAELRQWARGAAIDERFLALLQLYDEMRADEEFRSKIIGDFEGRPVVLTEIRQRIKELGQSAAYSLKGIKNALIAHDRIRLLARFFKACGCRGWVVLFDELERMTAFTSKQRLACWEELGWWHEAAVEAGAAIIPVFAGVLTPLRSQAENDAPLFESRASLLGAELRDERSLRGIEMMRSPFGLHTPSAEQDEAIKYRVKAIYEEAYDAPMPDVSSRGDVTMSIRSEIRRWITRWDLHRVYGGYEAAVVEEAVEHDTREIADDVLPAGDSDLD